MKRSCIAPSVTANIAAAAVCIILVAMLAACHAETAAQQPATLPEPSPAVQWASEPLAVEGRHGDGDFEPYEYY